MTSSTDEAQQSNETLEIVHRFNAAFNRHDVDAIMVAMSEDCVFENTSPAPDGETYVGQVAVRAFWESFFAASPHAQFETEDIFASGERCTVRWRYQWIDQNGTIDHVRGVDVFRIRAGKVAEKCSYVKG